jgi:hypothetical protein
MAMTKKKKTTKTSQVPSTAMTKRKMPAKAPTDRRVYRRKPRIRRPAAGLLGPHESIVLVIDPPMHEREQPVALTPNAGDILLRDATLDRVTVVNTTDRIVAYMMTVAPKLLIKAATVPWGRVATDLGKAVRESGLLDRFARLLR